MDLRIEVRLARRGATCDQAPAGTVHVLPAGRRWLIATRSAVCWRRAPDLTVPVTEWLPWERRVLGPAQRLEIRL